MARFRRSKDAAAGDEPSAEDRARAKELVDAAEAHIDTYYDPEVETDYEAALALLREAVSLDPHNSGAWYDLGLVQKWRRDWPDCLAANQRAVRERKHPEDQDPAFWNGGIAATALHDWAAARAAWRLYGLDLPPGEGPIDERLGMTPVRLPDGEVVWGVRIDPARVMLESIPLLEGDYRYGDIVLHDGAPEGERVYQGTRYPVFPVISRWAASPIPTSFVELVGDHELADALVDELWRCGVPSENWTSSVRMICKACSEGSVDHDDLGHTHDHAHDQGTDDSELPIRIGCSGTADTVRAVVVPWCEDHDLELIAVDQVD